MFTLQGTRLQTNIILAYKKFFNIQKLHAAPIKTFLKSLKKNQSSAYLHQFCNEMQKWVICSEDWALLKLVLCSQSNTAHWQGTRVVRYHTEA